MEKKIRINATDAATIMGENPWQGLLELWQIKTGRIDKPDLSEKESVQWGIRLEPIILKQLMKEAFGSNKEAQPQHTQVWLESHQHDFPMTGFADYYDGHLLIEIKTANQYALAEWESGVPRHYYWQLLHYMIITGQPQAMITCLVGGQKLIWHTVYYNEQDAQELIEAERWFYNLIITDTEPPMPEIPAPQESDMDADVERIIPQYLELKMQIKALESETDTLAAAIKTLVGENGTQRGDYYIASNKYIETNRFDSKALAQAEPDIYEKYTIKTGYYRLNIKEIKK